MVPEGAAIDVFVRSVGHPRLSATVRSLLEQEGPSLRITVLGCHGGHLSGLATLRADPRLRVVEPSEPLSRAASGNWCLLQAQAPLVALLDDVRPVPSGSLSALARALAADATAAAASYDDRASGLDAAALVLVRTEVARSLAPAGFEDSMDRNADASFWCRLASRGRILAVDPAAWPPVGVDDTRLLLDRQQARIAHLEAQLSAMHTSTSWRLTHPLRWLGSFIAGLRRGRLRGVARRGGQLMLAAWRRHGPWGVLRRAPGYLRRWPQILRELRRPVMPSQPAEGVADALHPVRVHPALAGPVETIDVRVSVVIPTLNAGLEFEWLLRKLNRQQGLREVEIIVVDSGSRDGTPERAAAAGARVVRIEPREFSHSHARNLGAEQASGDYLLFTVQDAYPMGELWLHGMVRYLLDHAAEGVVAASCAEYCRSDSDAMYDAMIDTHYRFLGCREADRVGALAGEDHASLRTMGQLSDVACLMPRPLFLRYRYRGDYAEDLDLGIRLIRDGHRIAMLASVKVIHSHLRPAYYYLKRAFVDVVFLAELFDDFDNPACPSVAGLLDGVAVVAEQASARLPGLASMADDSSPQAELSRWVQDARHWPLTPSAKPQALGDPRLDAFVANLLRDGAPARLAPEPMAKRAEAARMVIDGFVARLDHFNRFAAGLGLRVDDGVRRELAEAVRKIFAATLGAGLAQVVLDRRRPQADAAERAWAEELLAELRAGV